MHASPSIIPVHDLQGALDLSQAVTADVKQASDQAGVIATVLSEVLPDELRVHDVAQAIDQTEELEHKLADSAAQLVEVNKALVHELAKSKALNAELAASQQTIERLASDDRHVPAPKSV